MGFSINLLTLLAMVLAIGLVVDDAIVVVENIHRHLEEGKPPVQAAMQGAREIVGPVISMTITLAAVYAPIGFLGGLTGALFREFAFTLGGLGDRLRRDRADAVADDVLGVPQERRGRPVCQVVNRVFGSVTRWYGRQLDRSLDYRPITGDVRARPSLGWSASSICTRRRNSRPRRIRASCSRSPRRRNTPTSTTRLLRREARQGLCELPGNRSALRSQRHQRPAKRHRRHAAQAVGRAQAFVDRAEAAGPGPAQQDRRRQRVRLQPAAVARRSRRFAGADGDQFDQRLPVGL